MVSTIICTTGNYNKNFIHSDFIICVFSNARTVSQRKYSLDTQSTMCNFWTRKVFTVYKFHKRMYKYNRFPWRICMKSSAAWIFVCGVLLDKNTLTWNAWIFSTNSFRNKIAGPVLSVTISCNKFVLLPKYLMDNNRIVLKLVKQLILQLNHQHCIFLNNYTDLWLMNTK